MARGVRSASTRHRHHALNHPAVNNGLERTITLKLFSQGVVAIDGSKFKAVNSRDRNFSPGKIDARKEQIEQSIKRYLDALG